MRAFHANIMAIATEEKKKCKKVPRLLIHSTTTRPFNNFLLKNIVLQKRVFGEGSLMLISLFFFFNLKYALCFLISLASIAKSQQLLCPPSYQ